MNYLEAKNAKEVQKKTIENTISMLSNITELEVKHLTMDDVKVLISDYEKSLLHCDKISNCIEILHTNGITDFGYKVSIEDNVIAVNKHFHAIDRSTGIVHLVTKVIYGSNIDGKCIEHKRGDTISMGKHCFEEISPIVTITNKPCTCKDCLELVEAGKRREESYA